MQQTNFQIECIIADDASTDSNQDIIKKFSSKHPHLIKPILRKKNIGAQKNFIDAWKKAQGKYIALCEGDDYWTDPQKLQKQVDFLENNQDASFCFHRVKSLIQKNKKIISIYKGEKIRTKHLTKDYLLGLPTATLSLVAKNNLLFPEWYSLIYAGDKFLMLLLSLKGYGYCLPDYMGVYRVHESNITHTFAKKNPILELDSNFKGLDSFNEYSGFKFSEIITNAKQKLLFQLYMNQKKTKFDYFINRIFFFIKYESKNLNNFMNLIKIPFIKL